MHEFVDFAMSNFGILGSLPFTRHVSVAFALKGFAFGRQSMTSTTEIQLKYGCKEFFQFRHLVHEDDHHNVSTRNSKCSARNEALSKVFHVFSISVPIESCLRFFLKSSCTLAIKRVFASAPHIKFFCRRWS